MVEHKIVAGFTIRDGERQALCGYLDALARDGWEAVAMTLSAKGETQVLMRRARD